MLEDVDTDGEELPLDTPEVGSATFTGKGCFDADCGGFIDVADDGEVI